MSSILSIDSARARLNRTEHSGSPAVSRSVEWMARHLCGDSLLLPGECRMELEAVLKSLLVQYHPMDAIECQIVADMVSIRWRLTRLDRLEAAAASFENLVAVSEQRPQLIWAWHQSLVQLRRLRQHSPGDPQPPVHSRMAVISNADADDPIAPDRRRPQEPVLPTWLPQAA